MNKMFLIIMCIALLGCVWTAFAYVEPVIVDNVDPGFSAEGGWTISTSRPGYYGSDYRYAEAGDGSKTAAWTFNVVGGQYVVSAHWSAYNNRATNINYTILNNGNEIGVVPANQRENGDQFNALGTFACDTGTLVVVLPNKGDGYVIADAVKITAIILHKVIVTWDFPPNDTMVKAIGFDIRVNKDDSSLISVPKDVREWAGEVELILGQNVFDVRTKAENNEFSVWSEPAYYTLPSVLSPPSNLNIIR